MKIYTTFEPVPSRILALARLLLVAGPLPEDELVQLLQPRENTSTAKKTLDAAVECGLVLREGLTRQLNASLFPAGPPSPEGLDTILPVVLASPLLRQEVGGETNGFAILCAWLLQQKVLSMPTDRTELKVAAGKQGLSLVALQVASDARWDNVIYWARYLGLVAQTKETPSEGVVPDPTVFLRRHLKDLLPAGEEVEAGAFRARLGELCPVLDGGSVRADVLAIVEPGLPAEQLSDALTFALERLERAGEIRAWCPDDQRTFLLASGDRKIAYLERKR